MIEGQLVYINYKIDKTGEYGLVKDCFDGRVRIQTKNGSTIMYHFGKLNKEWTSEGEIKLTILTRNGQIVMAQKNWLGKPIPAPPYNGEWIFHDDDHLKEGSN